MSCTKSFAVAARINVQEKIRRDSGIFFFEYAQEMSKREIKAKDGQRSSQGLRLNNQLMEVGRSAGLAPEADPTED